MNNYLKAVVAVVIIIMLGVLIYYKLKPTIIIDEPIVAGSSIKGCYVATLAKDIYTLTVLSQVGETFEGTLSFKNFEKDSSSGTYNGTYKDGILLGDYAFQSEGMNSVMQVIFKKSGNDFVRGYGDVTADGTHFTDINKIIYDSSYIFKQTEECGKM